MQVVFGIIFFIVICIAVYYFYQHEKDCECIYDLEIKLDDEKYTTKMLRERIDCIEKENQDAIYDADKKIQNAVVYAEDKIKTKLYEEIFQEQDYNSVENLKNKIKTILAPTKATNIE